MDKVWFWAFGWTKNIIKTKPGILGSPGQLGIIRYTKNIIKTKPVILVALGKLSNFGFSSIIYHWMTIIYHSWHRLTAQRIFGNSVQRVISVTLGILGSIHYHWLPSTDHWISLSALVDSPRNIWWPISTSLSATRGTQYPMPTPPSCWLWHQVPSVTECPRLN